MRNQVQLIAYADRFGTTISGLGELLKGPLAGLFGGVHLLPFFTPIDGSDGGFDPIDHATVDPRLGQWQDVTALGAEVDVIADLIVNHISAASPQFLDYLRHGDRSRFAGMFLTMASVFPNGVTEDDLLKIYRPRPGLPFTPISLADRSRRIFWTTFTGRQIDLDVSHPETVAYMRGILERLAESRVRVVRLDAVGYAVKTPGTSCFMTPDTFRFIEKVTGWAHDLGFEVLVEIHSHFRAQIEVAPLVDWVYDFALPPLVLHALLTGRSTELRSWLEIRPRNAVTVLDTHDGIGVLDVGADPSVPDRPGLLGPIEIDRLVESIHENSSGESRLATGAAASNLDLYQVNCTYYDALGRNDRRYLLARVLQLFVPAIPQVYYVGLLAGHNDLALLQRSGTGRDINRHNYRRSEIASALERPVVQRLLSVIRFRNRHPAFQGDFDLGDATGDALALTWTNGDEYAELVAHLQDATFSLRFTSEGRARTVSDLADLDI